LRGWRGLLRGLLQKCGKKQRKHSRMNFDAGTTEPNAAF
jgi:hypothetical protein